MVNLADSFLADASSLQSDGIHPESVRVAFGGSLRKWQHILRDRRSSADIGVCANSYELVHRTEGPHHGPILHRDMPPKSRSIGHDDMVANDAIMRDVRVGHEERVIPHAGQAAAFDRAPIDGDEFPNLVVIADLQACWFAGITDVLRCKADRTERKESVIGADSGWPPHGHVRDKVAAFPQFHIRADHTIGTNLAGRMDFRAGIDDGCGVNAQKRVPAEYRVSSTEYRVASCRCSSAAEGAIVLSPLRRVVRYRSAFLPIRMCEAPGGR